MLRACGDDADQRPNPAHRPHRAGAKAAEIAQRRRQPRQRQRREDAEKMRAASQSVQDADSKRRMRVPMRGGTFVSGGSMGVNVNMVSGGLLRTTDASRATPEAVFDIVAAQTPLGRVTTPEDLADAVLFFASPWARAVTGQNLVVDGGLVFG